MVYTFPSIIPNPPPSLSQKSFPRITSLTHNPSGGGKGSWSAWKAGELARRYEAAGGDYEDTGENKNKAQKGPPEKKEG